ncbi:MAG: DsrE family protein [Sporomusaceae bacterium]|nr:DsrE family protein [Sporomusaceae bacterium]
MYTLNSKLRGWWEDVTLIVWGASTKLLVEDEELQERIRQMIEAGVDVVACVACAKMFGAVEKLESLGIEVKSMGQPLTQLLKAGKKVLTI